MSLRFLFLFAIVGVVIFLGPSKIGYGVQTWLKDSSSVVKQGPAAGRSPEVPSSTKTVFERPSDAPYAISFTQNTPQGLGRWDVVVENAVVRGLYHVSSSTYDVSGGKIPSGDGFTMRATMPNGEMVAIATTTWRGKEVEGETLIDTKKTPILAVDPSTTGAKLSFLQARGAWRDAPKQLGCEFDLTLPVVEKNDRVSLVIAEKINQTIRRTMLEDRRTPEQAKDTYVRTCKDDVIAERASWKDGSDPGSMFERSKQVNTIVGINTFPWLSFQVDEYAYSGGAHGNSRRVGITFDLRTGALTSFEQALGIRPEHVLRVQALIGRELLLQDRAMGQMMFDDVASSVRAYVDASFREQERLWSAGITGMTTSTNFVLTQEGARILFQPYEVAPYAAGLPTVFLSHEELKPVK